MRKLICILNLLIFISCGQPDSKKDSTSQLEPIKKDSVENTTNEENDSLTPYVQKDSKERDYHLVEIRRSSLNLIYEDATLFHLTDTIKADFNGDGKTDKAIYVKENESSGIVIIHGESNEEIRIGFGKQFAHLTEFDWVDYWGLVMDKETSKTTFTEEEDVLGSQVVKLQNPSITLGNDDIGGGLITYLNGEYVWIHQTC